MSAFRERQRLHVKRRAIIRAIVLAGLAACVPISTSAVIGDVGAAPGVTLTTPNPEPARGTVGQLHATAAIDVTNTTMVIQIFNDNGSLIATCSTGTTCDASVPDPNLSPYDERAFIATVGTYRPTFSWWTTGAGYRSNQTLLFWGGYFPVWSDQCTAPTASVVDGYVGGAYERLLFESSPTQVMICYRLNVAGVYYVGGNLVVTESVPSVALPMVDTAAQACSTNSGNQVPGPHPAVAGTILNAALSIDTYSSGSAVWLCFQYGAVQERVAISAPTGSTPSAQQYDDIPESSPLPTAPPSNYPSGQCAASGGSAATQFADISVAGNSAYGYTWQPNATTIDVCARVMGPISAGGLLSATAPQAPTVIGPGLSPVVTVSNNVTPCTFIVASLTSPTAALFATTPPGANPATICVGLGGTQEAVTLGTAGSITVPGLPAVTPPTFTPDPGTP